MYYFSLVPRLLWGQGKKEPGTHCWRMCELFRRIHRKIIRIIFMTTCRQPQNHVAAALASASKTWLHWTWTSLFNHTSVTDDNTIVEHERPVSGASALNNCFYFASTSQLVRDLPCCSAMTRCIAATLLTQHKPFTHDVDLPLAGLHY